MTGLRNIHHSLAVRYTSNHLYCRLLEDLGSRTSSGEDRSRSASNHCKVQWASRWNKCWNSSSRECCIVEGWEAKRWSGRKRSGDGWSKRTWSSREPASVHVSVQGADKRCDNDDLHHRWFHRLLDADVHYHHGYKNIGKAVKVSLDGLFCT